MSCYTNCNCGSKYHLVECACQCHTEEAKQERRLERAREMQQAHATVVLIQEIPAGTFSSTKIRIAIELVVSKQLAREACERVDTEDDIVRIVVDALRTRLNKPIDKALGCGRNDKCGRNLNHPGDCLTKTEMKSIINRLGFSAGEKCEIK